MQDKTPEITDNQVLAITTAYEQGVGKGLTAGRSNSEISNPYSSEWSCDAAWSIGYDEGKKRARQEPHAAPAAVAVPAELLERVIDSLSSFAGNKPHTKADMATLEQLNDLLSAASAAAAPVVLPEPVATIYTMEALAPGGAVKYHAQVHKALPSGTKLLAEPEVRALLAQAATASAPQAQADAQDDSALLDAMERQRIAVVPEYEGPWDAEVYNGDEKPNHHGTGATPREAIRAAIAAAKGEQQ